MSLVLELPPELESELAAQAADAGIPLSEYALRLLAGQSSRPALRSGAELLDYWKAEGLVGTKPEIVDAPAHARVLREQAEKRARA